jgi:hypothetical protein
MPAMGGDLESVAGLDIRAFIPYLGTPPSVTMAVLE